LGGPICPSAALDDPLSRLAPGLPSEPAGGGKGGAPAR
jgi:hypothetical protein